MRNIDFASKQLNKIRNRIQHAAALSNRNADDIRLIGASKKQAADKILAFAEAGLNEVGENYLQEAIQKQQNIAHAELQWHFIGKLQSNKAKQVAQHFSWVHGVDRLKLAVRLSQYRAGKTPMQILVQLNVDLEDNKNGIAVNKAPELCDQIAQLEHLCLRGFMLIPKAREKDQDQRKPFASGRETLELTNQRYGLNLDSLSMGMSGDLEAAIAEGSTMVRIGSDLFGPRE